MLFGIHEDLIYHHDAALRKPVRTLTMIIITGIGRSGTSFTAKVLCEAGVDFKGNWFDEKIKAGMEYDKVADLNNRLMKGLASSLDEAIAQSGAPEIKSELSGGVVVKDPRFILTLDFWLSAGFRIEHIIHCARDYREVYDSSTKSGCGIGGDLISGINILSYEGFKIFSSHAERIFFRLAAKSGIPVTTIWFPKSVNDFSEVEKLGFLVDRERLKEAWERTRRPDMVGSKAGQITEADDKQKLFNAYAKLGQKEQQIRHMEQRIADINLELGLKEEQLDRRADEINQLTKELSELKASWPKKMERTFRKKIVIPTKELFSSPPKIWGNSIPKSGTHLLSGIFMNMGFRIAQNGNVLPWLSSEEIEQKIKCLKNGEYLIGHRKFDENFNRMLEKNKIPHFLIVRDPRDVVVSKAFYIARTPEHAFCSYFNNIDSPKRFIAAIKGVPGESGDAPAKRYGVPSIAEIYKQYLPWLREKRCLLIRFEDIVGNRGGGNDEKQFLELRRIAKHLKMPLKDLELKEIAFKTFNEKSLTFRKGQIGDWVNWLDDEMLSLLKKEENIYKEFGYSI